MDYLGAFSRFVFQPIIYLKRGMDVNYWQNMVDGYEKLNPLDLRKHQNAALSDLLNYAFNYTPYYRALFEHTGIPLNLEIEDDKFLKLPILTKDIVRNEYNKLLSTDPKLKGVYRNMTGGSTGTPLIFSQDIVYKSAAAGTERSILKWWDINPGDRVTAFWGADRELNDRTLRERLMMWLQRENIFDSFAMSEEKMAEFARELVAWKPIYIKGYASSLHLFANFLLANRQFVIRPKAVRSTAETLFDWQRRDIEKAFGCKVFNFYGSREVNNLAVECPQQTGLHVLAGTRIVEILNDRGEPVSSGEIGRIVVTDLVNHAMPFIRYENGDLGVWSDESCPCGRHYPVLKQIIGRVSDVLVGDKGQYVHGEFITHLFYGVTGVINFQVVQHSIGKLEIIIQQGPKFNQSDLEPICAKIHAKLGKCDIDIRLISAFERTTSGKHRFIISKISPFTNLYRDVTPVTTDTMQ